MKYLLLIFCLVPLFGNSQTGFIKLHFKTGDSLSTNYAYLYNNTGFSKPYVRIDNEKGEKISIDRVTHIEGIDQKGKYRYFKPIFLKNKEIWGERTFTSNRINLYYSNIFSSTWDAAYKTKYFQYSKDNAPLQKLTYANLKKDLSDNLNALAYIKKGNKLRITQLVLYGLGAALVVAGTVDGLSSNGLSSPNNPAIKTPPAFIAGAIALTIPWFLNKPKQDNFVKAIKAYN